MLALWRAGLPFLSGLETANPMYRLLLKSALPELMNKLEEWDKDPELQAKIKAFILDLAREVEKC